MPKEQANDHRIAIELFDRIKAQFPDLTVELDDTLPESTLAVRIPKQLALSTKVNLFHQGNQLVTMIDSFHTHGFESDLRDNAEEHFQVIKRFIQGDCRLHQTLRGKRVSKAELQVLNDNQWHTVEVSGSLLSPWFLKKTIKIIMNESVDKMLSTNHGAQS